MSLLSNTVCRVATQVILECGVDVQTVRCCCCANATVDAGSVCDDFEVVSSSNDGFYTFVSSFGYVVRVNGLPGGVADSRINGLNGLGSEAEAGE